LKNQGEQTVGVQWGLCKLSRAKIFSCLLNQTLRRIFELYFLGQFSTCLLFMHVVNGLHMCRPDCVNWYYTGLLSAISSSLAQTQTIRECIRRAVRWYYKECVSERKIVLTWTVLLHCSCSKSVQTHTILNLQYLWHQP